MAYIKPQVTNAQAVEGSRVWYFVKAWNALKTAGPAMPAFQMDAEFSSSSDSNSEKTKQGNIVSAGTKEQSLDLSQKVAVGDPATEIIEAAHNAGEKIHVWRVVVDKNNAEKVTTGVPSGEVGYGFHAKYGQALVSDFNLSDPVEGQSEASYTLAISGSMQDNDVKNNPFVLTDKDIDMLEVFYGYQNPDEVGQDAK